MTLLITILLVDKSYKSYLYACKRNWLILAFILLAFISLGWTIHIEITLYRALILLFVSLLAIYIGASYNLLAIRNILSLYFVFLAAVNLLFVLAFPSFGIMSNPIYMGAWQGLFWHRNYLGCFMSLGILVYLVNLLTLKNILHKDFFLNLIMLALSSFLLLKSKSATAIITTLVVLGLVLMIFIWTKLRHKLKLAHYLGFAFVGVIIAVMFYLKLDFFLGLLGRNSSLTGRIPMWTSLYNQLIIHRFWLGYGYGAIWHLQGIRDGMAELVHWATPVMIGDNGFIDILLHLGILGLSLFLSLMTLGFIKGIKYFLQEHTLESAFLILILVYAIVANISLSLILESESLIWMIVIAVFISISKLLKSPHLSTTS